MYIYLYSCPLLVACFSVEASPAQHDAKTADTFRLLRIAPSISFGGHPAYAILDLYRCMRLFLGSSNSSNSNSSSSSSSSSGSISSRSVVVKVVSSRSGSDQ